MVSGRVGVSRQKPILGCYTPSYDLSPQGSLSLPGTENPYLVSPGTSWKQPRVRTRCPSTLYPSRTGLRKQLCPKEPPPTSGPPLVDLSCWLEQVDLKLDLASFHPLCWPAVVASQLLRTTASVSTASGGRVLSSDQVHCYSWLAPSP